MFVGDRSSDRRAEPSAHGGADGRADGGSYGGAYHWTVNGVSFASDALLILEDLDDDQVVSLRVSQRDAPSREFSEVTTVTLTVLAEAAPDVAGRRAPDHN